IDDVKVGSLEQIATDPSISAPEEIATSDIVDSPPLILYDDFENAAFNGVVDTNKWLREEDYPEFCGVSQQEGVLIFDQQLNPEDAIGCKLFVQPSQTVYEQLESFEAMVKLSSNHNGKPLNQGIEFARHIQDGERWFFCGLDVKNGELVAHLLISQWSSEAGYEIEFSNGILADYDTWYKLRLAVTPGTPTTVSCFVDDKVVGTTSPTDADILPGGVFTRRVTAYRSEDAFATAYVDDVKIGE
ncbi:MAG: hypothetical protein AAF485_13325, partial [Chloroflexota bacterium]